MSTTPPATLHTYQSLVLSFSDFFAAAVHLILYQRAVYPPNSFARVRKYSFPLWQNRHPGVCKWISDAVAAVEAQALEGTVSRTSLLILSSQQVPLERYVFSIEDFPIVSPSDTLALFRSGDERVDAELLAAYQLAQRANNDVDFEGVEEEEEEGGDEIEGDEDEDEDEGDEEETYDDSEEKNDDSEEKNDDDKEEGEEDEEEEEEEDEDEDEEDEEEEDEEDEDEEDEEDEEEDDDEEGDEGQVEEDMAPDEYDPDEGELSSNKSAGEDSESRQSTPSPTEPPTQGHTAIADLSGQFAAVFARLVSATEHLGPLPKGSIFTIAIELRDSNAKSLSEYPRNGRWVPCASTPGDGVSANMPARADGEAQQRNSVGVLPLNKGTQARRTVPLRAVEADPFYMESWLEYDASLEMEHVGQSMATKNQARESIRLEYKDL